MLLKLFQLTPTIEYMEIDNVSEIEGTREDPVNRRTHPRSVFTFPVEFEWFSQRQEAKTFAGYLKDISLGGACLEFEDPYGRFHIGDAVSARVKLLLSIPREDRTVIFAIIQWAKKAEGTSQVRVGISFKGLDFKDLTVIERLIGLKSKDHNMMWNLWEQYFQQSV